MNNSDGYMMGIRWQDILEAFDNNESPPTTFLDCGSHDGQTLDEVLKPDYGFDKVVAFEPMPREFAHIRAKYADHDNIEFCNYGLSDHTGTVNVYGTNDGMEATIWPGKNDTDATAVTECQMVEASYFIRRIPEDQRIILKLNCEGAEVPILHNLIDTGAIHRLGAVMIDWDIRKVPGMEHEEQGILERLAETNFDRYQLCDSVMVGATHQDRIANWLAGVL